MVGGLGLDLGRRGKVGFTYVLFYGRTHGANSVGFSARVVSNGSFPRSQISRGYAYQVGGVEVFARGGGDLLGCQGADLVVEFGLSFDRAAGV
jgi:hypothetical protein